MGIVDEDVVRVRDSVDMVALVTQYTQLRKSGAQWSGLCPFHGEKSPSFSVSAQPPVYYCFGCQAQGDAITFVREIEHLDFVGAVEFLAAKSGITLRYTEKGEDEGRKRRRQLVEVMERAVQWYHERLLTSPDAGAARKYLRERGLTGDDVRRYRIGWAPDDWDALAKTLRLGEDILTDTGLGFVNKRGRRQDSFRARILFPILDVNGDPVALGGRILPGTEGPKYKNSQETVLYHKSRVLYGLNWCKSNVVTAGEVIVCEGYTDVIGFARVGIDRAVAPCGTAFTEEHVKLLQRFAKRVLLAFDADSAGRNAAERFYEWEQRHEIEVYVIDLPAGRDPGQLSVEDPDALVAAVAAARPFLAFRVERVLGGADLSTAEARARVAERALAVVAEHPNELVRDHYLMEVADRCQLEPGLLRTRLAAEIQRQASGRDDAPVIDLRAAALPERDDDVELQALRLAVHRPEDVPAFVDESLFARRLHRDTFEALVGAHTLQQAIDDAEPDVASLLRRLVVQDADDLPADKVVGRLVDEAAMRELRRLEAHARQSGDLTIARDLAGLQLAISGLRDSGWEIDHVEGLLHWLRADAEGRA
ncbi:MAG: DNA primase [Acidimicrobiales bacterium]|nr:DNA primase [Acidimicrobiales bacterium]